jgi:hypothetical protein
MARALGEAVRVWRAPNRTQGLLAAIDTQILVAAARIYVVLSALSLLWVNWLGQVRSPLDKQSRDALAVE